jgi:hypothetical protein
VSTTDELLDRKVAAPVYKTENTAVGIRHANHVTPSIRKNLAISSPTSGGRSVRIVRSRTQATGFCLVNNNNNNNNNTYSITEVLGISRIVRLPIIADSIIFRVSL